MANIITITNPDDPRIAPFARLTDRQLRACHQMMVVESPKVISVALDAGCEPTALLCESKHITGDAAAILERCPADMPVYTGSPEVLEKITGYRLTRGVLCAMHRPAMHSLEDVLAKSSRVAVIHGVCDTTNIGTIFRSAAALGIDGVILSSDSCDVLNRRSIRTSMGSVFLVPWTIVGAGVNCVHQLEYYGFATAAMALCNNSIAVNSVQLKHEPRLAIIVGTEGEGLPKEVIEAARYRVMIPMAHGVDSLNVATAAGIAFWELTAYQK